VSSRPVLAWISLFSAPKSCRPVWGQGVSKDIEAPAPRDLAKGRQRRSSEVVAQPMAIRCDPPSSANDRDRDRAPALLAYQDSSCSCATHACAVDKANGCHPAGDQKIESGRSGGRRRGPDAERCRFGLPHPSSARMSHFSRLFRMSQNLSL